ncbi:bacteriophage T4 gp5 trimerisation domain-containing protein, partial [Dialister invisus]|uniref:bacteriophage T4 gp5 trimerisation domain-containing protein n=1 Tax=Dialister invisus TaxID=218538 RepID=UPI003AB7B022
MPIRILPQRRICRMKKNERVAADKALSDRIDKQEEKTTNISYNAGGGTNVDGVNIKNGAMSGVTKLNDISVNGNALSGISTLETTGDATIGGDLTVKGTFKPSEVLVKDDNNNLTHIKPGDIESKNLNFTGDIHNNTVEGSRFKFDKTGLDASAVGMGPTGGNGAQLKLQKDKITQEVVDSNSNSNLLEQTATGSVHTVTNGTDSTKIEQTAMDVNVTAESGNINNKAKNITNTTSEDMTNTIGKNLTTTVGGNQTTDVTGDQSNTVGGKLTETVTGDVTEDYKANQTTTVAKDQTTTVGGNQTTHVKGNQANTVDGTLTETVTGDVTEDYK